MEKVRRETHPEPPFCTFRGCDRATVVAHISGGLGEVAPASAAHPRLTGYLPAADEPWKIAARAEFLLEFQPRLRHNLIGHDCEHIAGMCGGCRVSVAGKPVLACGDGPEFDAHQVDFEQFALRNRAYVSQEKLVLERHQSRVGVT